MLSMEDKTFLVDISVSWRAHEKLFSLSSSSWCSLSRLADGLLLNSEVEDLHLTTGSCRGEADMGSAAWKHRLDFSSSWELTKEPTCRPRPQLPIGWMGPATPPSEGQGGGAAALPVMTTGAAAAGRRAQMGLEARALGGARTVVPVAAEEMLPELPALARHRDSARTGELEGACLADCGSCTEASLRGCGLETCRCTET
mmetsp:Transcript_89890/g.155645  ORF Transcript_89890/g.155645 Transcript_89890/m.155645 type:complete len:200 (+) Transcript_89890:1143-1742(+)